MDELLKKVVKALEDGDVEVKVVRMGSSDEPKTINMMDVEKKKESAEIARLNRILYEAHINEGFTSEEALAMTIAAMNI